MSDLTTPPAFSPGDPIWADLLTTDMDRARAFYGSVLGWTFEETPESFGGYVNALKDGSHVAGLMPKGPDMGEVPDVWSLYFATEDASASIEAVTAAGGTVHMPVTEIADLGAMAMVADPGGASFGFWQAGVHTGFGARQKAGTPYWFELHTRDFPAVQTFYPRALGVDLFPMSDTPEFRYFTFGEGRDATAGIMDASAFLPEGVPSTWQVYWGVDDADAASAAAVSLGGSVLQEAEDTPFGRIAALTDPFGTPFKIAQGTPGR
jgi:predicted enzyme related to lactoylglutathione lyase